ncbi:MAG: sensor histidine kinase [Balneola sp.]|nr:MAG: sensor histidine kinase [Balneola sp.]
MINKWLQGIKSPWSIMLVSIAVSEILYIGISFLVVGVVYPIGIIFSFIIPAVISYPISYAKQRLIDEIEAQRIELDQVNTLNQRLILTVSHDIKAPISSISMMSDSIASGDLTLEEVTLHMKEISSNIKVFLSFLDDLLWWSKYQMDKKPLKPESFCTEELLKQNLELYEPILKEKRIQLTADNLASEVFIDKGSYSFAVRNVLHNAIKYSAGSSEIKISVNKNGKFVTTKIEDSGQGIPKEKLNKILSRGLYISEKGTNGESGIGFGLRATIDYIENQGGKLIIDSVENKGTSVSIMTPYP